MKISQIASALNEIDDEYIDAAIDGHDNDTAENTDAYRHNKIRINSDELTPLNENGPHNNKHGNKKAAIAGLCAAAAALVIALPFGLKFLGGTRIETAASVSSDVISSAPEEAPSDISSDDRTQSSTDISDTPDSKESADIAVITSPDISEETPPPESSDVIPSESEDNSSDIPDETAQSTAYISETPDSKESADIAVITSPDISEETPPPESSDAIPSESEDNSSDIPDETAQSTAYVSETPDESAQSGTDIPDTPESRDDSESGSATVTVIDPSDYNVRRCRTNGYHDGARYPVTYLIRSENELNGYYEDNKDKYSLGSENDGLSDTFFDVISGYDSSFFDSHNLALILLEESSGSVTHEVKRITVCDTSPRRLTAVIEIQIPEMGTCDMAEWHIIIELPKEYVPDDCVFEAQDIMFALPDRNSAP